MNLFFFRTNRHGCLIFLPNKHIFHVILLLFFFSDFFCNTFKHYSEYTLKASGFDLLATLYTSTYEKFHSLLLLLYIFYPAYPYVCKDEMHFDVPGRYCLLFYFFVQLDFSGRSIFYSPSFINIKRSDRHSFVLFMYR